MTGVCFWLLPEDENTKTNESLNEVLEWNIQPTSSDASSEYLNEKSIEVSDNSIYINCNTSEASVWKEEEVLNSDEIKELYIERNSGGTCTWFLPDSENTLTREINDEVVESNI